jgi:DNA-directed RNA polymerase specialized sigma24 family protein
MSCLFPDQVAEVRKAGPNALSEPERHKLVEKVIPWCRRLARDHATAIRLATGRRLEIDDLEGEAFVAAAEAAIYYDPRRGVGFTTYVRPWVQTHLTQKTDPRYTVQAAGMEFPERVADRDDGPAEVEADTPDADEARLLGNLQEPARTIVRLCVFEGLSPAQVAIQAAGMPYYDHGVRRVIEADKDVKLIMRNAAAKLARGVATGDAVDAMIGASGNDEHSPNPKGSVCGGS